MMKIIGSYGVDAGNISIVDLKYIESKGGSFGKFASSTSKKVTLEPGKYRVNVSMDDSYCCYEYEDGEESIKDFSGEIETSGEVVIGDVCYLFSSDEVGDVYWSNFLDESETDYLKNNNKNCIFLDTGGDGEFKVEVEFTKIS
jgi:hypothetical protein